MIFTEIKMRVDHAWKQELINNSLMHYAGEKGNFHSCDPQTLSQQLSAIHGHYAAIVETEDYIIAAVDRIRSYPIFYYQDTKHFIIGNSADLIKESLKLVEVVPAHLKQFMMFGYVLNDGTLYQGLKQLLPGEGLVWNKKIGQLSIIRYDRYLPAPEIALDEAEWLLESAAVLNRAIKRMMVRADGRPIWVALSGGFDSRLILAKLKEFNYQPLHAFSYGVANNFEAKTAKRVAAQLDVDWHFMESKPKRAAQLFSSQLRKEYTDYAAALCAVPSYMDFEAINQLKHYAPFASDSIVVNGQSGDFITGGHVPLRLYQKPNEDLFFELVIAKHGSLWPALNKASDLQSLKNAISVNKPELNHLTLPDRLAAWYENWECEERQVKAVINGQRVYDYFGLSWHLPLWDTEMMNFWKRVPIPYKLNQRLYIQYLKEYNYAGVFSVLRDPANIWPPRYRYIPWIAKGIGMFCGAHLKQQFYKRMYYYANYHNQYALLGHSYYLQHYQHTRNFVSLAARHLIQEWGIEPSFS